MDEVVTPFGKTDENMEKLINYHITLWHILFGPNGKWQ
jgi:hypothetical protein